MTIENAGFITSRQSALWKGLSVLNRGVCRNPQGVTRCWRALRGASVLTLALAAPSLAQTVPPITVGGGVQTSFVHTERDKEDGKDEFVLNSVRLYVTGSATDKIKLGFPISLWYRTRLTTRRAQILAVPRRGTPSQGVTPSG